MVQRRGRTHPALRLERVSSWQRKTRRGVADANVYVEKASGARHDRPVLKRALVACEKAACYKLDRVGRSLVHLTKVLAEPEKARRPLHDHRGRAQHEGLDRQARAPHHRRHPEFERSLILKRAMAGVRLGAGGQVGRRLVAPPDLERAKELLARPGLKAADVAAMLKVSERTLFRELRAARGREEVGV